MHDRTALAEAEVEYEMHTSPSVYVRYRLTSAAGGNRSSAGRKAGLDHHLDHDALDAARLARRRLPPGLRICSPRTGWVRSTSWPRRWLRPPAPPAGWKTRTRSPAFQVRGWSGSPSPIPSWSARFWECWPPTSPPTRARARCTPLRRMASTTSPPAPAMA